MKVVPGLGICKSSKLCDVSLQLNRLLAGYSTDESVETKRTNLCSAVNDALHIVMENDPRYDVCFGPINVKGLHY